MYVSSSLQAIEHSPTNEEQAGPSGASEQNANESDNIEARGGRFSKSADERQKMLMLRKEEMLQHARRLECCYSL